jgi:metallophosphoesterase superfamily enzyme
MHPRFIRFLKNIDRKYQCNKWVHLGDLVDWHAISYHEKDTDLPSASYEKTEAMKQVRKLHNAFPDVEFLIGNHDSLPQRKARTVGIPDSEVVSFKDSWGLDGWNIHPRYADIKIDGVIYRHGDKEKGGQRLAALANAKEQHCSLVQGHLHAQLGIEHAGNHDRLIWGMQVGCGTLPNHPAMKYSRVYSARPILGCGVIINGKPQIEAMPL